MASGIEIFDARGNLIMDGSGRYARIIEVFNPYSIGVPGSRSFPGFDPASIQAIVTQGYSRILVFRKSGVTFSWSYADSYSWPELSGTPSVTVLIK
jgi:hypothetical protein